MTRGEERRAATPPLRRAEADQASWADATAFLAPVLRGRVIGRKDIVGG
jgi:hypothetical protein